MINKNLLVHVSSRLSRINGVLWKKFSTIRWKRRPMRSNLSRRRRLPKRSTSERTSPQRDTKNCSSSRISATNFFSSWRSVAFELIKLALAAELDPEYSAASISIFFFGLICSMEILKIGIKKRTEIRTLFYLTIIYLTKFLSQKKKIPAAAITATVKLHNFCRRSDHFFCA